jgi:hypothetical protein
MYAPAKWPPAKRAPLTSKEARSDELRGYPRHATAEGCQFLLVSGSGSPDERKVFTAPDGTPVAGTIRWILEERVGFAFDRPLEDGTLRALSDEVAAVTTLELAPASASAHG